jgi:xanthine dehydrogenase YagS FAD-binding subunit
MQNFGYSAAERLDQAFASDGANTMLIAGGTELLNWFRLGIAAPADVIDIGRLEGLNRIEVSGDRLSIGALATLGEVGEHPLVKEHAAVLGEACLAAASPQIRNRATLGGNVLQKTRCTYFRAEAPLPWGCNKREPGTGCAARNGLNDRHAIFGWSDACVATHPSDPIVALAALDAEAELASSSGERRLPIAELFLTQEEAAAEIAAGRIRDKAENAARIETRLRPGEVIMAYHLPLRGGERSAYVKVRERASYEYALVSAAAVLSVEAGRITRASIALGSVAQKPWRLASAEARLIGQPPQRDAVLPILKESLAEARPLQHNHYKLAMSAGAAARAIVNAGGGA